MVKGIRAHKKNEVQYINRCIGEIKEELQKKQHGKKADAVLKLVYLNMLGYDMGWAAFNIVETMSQPKFSHKRIGYLAASIVFDENTEVTLLTTNLFKKDFTSSNQYEVGLAINCLANIVTEELACDLVADVVSLLNSGKTYVRKKAVLVLYKLFLKFPKALRPSFPRLKEKIDDREVSVVSCAVNVVCELARKNPANFLSLAPIFFKLLTASSNNWMLIKIVKLLGALTPLEPRLAKKMVAPITNLLNTTPAKSLLYECIHTVSIGMTAHASVTKLALEKLKGFIEDADQNLKYLGLVALNNFMKVHPKAVSEYRETVMLCLDDEDITICHRALELVAGMVSKKNLSEIVELLMKHASNAEGSFRNELIGTCIQVCQSNSYANVTDFEWYIGILVELSQFHGMEHGVLIASQLIDVVVRVKSVRQFGVKAMVNMLVDPKILGQCNRDSDGLSEVLYAAAWIAGEFSEYIDNYKEVVEALLKPRVAALTPHVQAVYVQNVLKVYIAACRVLIGSGKTATTDLLGLGDDLDPLAEQVPVEPDEPSAAAELPFTLSELTELVLAHLPPFSSSVHVEVQERACTVTNVVSLLSSLHDSGTSVYASFASIFDEELNPVAPKSQKKVPLPEGLDLDAWINEQPVEPEPEEVDIGGGFSLESNEVFEKKMTKKEMKRMERERRREEKRKEDPFYLPSKAISESAMAAVDDIPIVDLGIEGGDLLGLEGAGPSAHEKK